MSGVINYIKTLITKAMELSDDTYEQVDQSTQYVRSPLALHRDDRIEKEVFMIAPQFSKHDGVFFDEDNKDWVMIPKYPLPERWRERWCKLLIVFPGTYPVVPPVGFYLNKQFHLKSGGTDNHLIGQASHGAPNLIEQGWYWYCVHMAIGTQGGWQPSHDYRKQDNLWTFLTMIRETLTNDY